MCLDIIVLKISGGLPGGAVVENLPGNAGDTGSSPGLGGSHMLRSSWAREPQLLSLRVWSLCSATGEAVMVRGLRTAMKGGLRLPQLGRTLAQKQRPNTAIKKIYIYIGLKFSNMINFTRYNPHEQKLLGSFPEFLRLKERFFFS